MNSLTTHYRRSQLIALPVPGGKAKVEYCYAVNVPGDRVIVTHSFAEWAVGDFNRQKETVLCDKLFPFSFSTITQSFLRSVYGFILISHPTFITFVVFRLA